MGTIAHLLQQSPNNSFADHAASKRNNQLANKIVIKLRLTTSILMLRNLTENWSNVKPHYLELLKEEDGRRMSSELRIELKTSIQQRNGAVVASQYNFSSAAGTTFDFATDLLRDCNSFPIFSLEELEFPPLIHFLQLTTTGYWTLSFFCMITRFWIYTCRKGWGDKSERDFLNYYQFQVEADQNDSVLGGGSFRFLSFNIYYFH